jgi:predicted component of type VI protein secretion system
LDESGVGFKLTEMVPIGPQAHVAVGANREERDSFYPQLRSLGGLHVSDIARDIGEANTTV